MECEVCGSTNIARREFDGHVLDECGLCGNLQGDDKSVALVQEMRAGRERGLDDEVIPLVSVLESADVFQVLGTAALLLDRDQVVDGDDADSLPLNAQRLDRQIGEIVRQHDVDQLRRRGGIDEAPRDEIPVPDVLLAESTDLLRRHREA